MKKIGQKRKVLTNPTAVRSVLEWWDAVTKDSRIFDVLEAVRSKKIYKRGAIQETQHGQNIASGYESGFEDALEGLISLTPSDMPERDADEYKTHPDLNDET